uniref:TRAP transporter large permease subunit n=1 Tax=Gemmiger formicilis TaxID=745368 RepID=UPI003FF08B8F
MLLVLLFLGVPISYAIAVSSLTAILSSIDLNVAVLTAAQRTFVGMSKFSLTAIPFFILAGNIMNQGGIAKRLVDFVMAILGKLPGALLVIPALLIFPILAPVVLFLAVAVFFKEQKRADEIVQQRREEIETELPRFVNTVEQELRSSRDVLNILKAYQHNAGHAMK